ncbi:MAG: ribosomal protein S18-alanine N-acetyltransferase [Lachnospiraceae bacterium]
MKIEDILQVAALEEECFSMPWSAHELQKSMEQSNYLFLVAEEDYQICGYIGLYQILDEGNITNVAVTKFARKQGVGSQLLKALMQCALSQGVSCMTLEVRESNEPAIHLYKKFGFSVEGVRKNYYENPVENGYIMWNYDIRSTMDQCPAKMLD